MFDFNQWIAENGLSEYKELFEKHQLTTAETLQSLTSDDLFRMGIELIGVQKKILQARSTLFSKKQLDGFCPFTQSACSPACKLFTLLMLSPDGRERAGCSLHSLILIRAYLEGIQRMLSL